MAPEMGAAAAAAELAAEDARIPPVNFPYTLKVDGKVYRVHFMTTKQQLAQLSKLSKAELITMHQDAGGLMSTADYRSWTKDELIEAVIEDQGGR